MLEQENELITITLTELQRVNALALSGTPGGDSLLCSEIRSSAFQICREHAKFHTAPSCSRNADTTPPSVRLDYGTFALEVT